MLHFARFAPFNCCFKRTPNVTLVSGEREEMVRFVLGSMARLFVAAVEALEVRQTIVQVPILAKNGTNT